MEENEITTIIKKTDAYDHQTLTHPEETYYDGKIKR